MTAPVNHLACMGCRPVWQSLRAALADSDVPKDRHPEAIRLYLDRVHNADHDEDRALREIREEAERQQALSQLVRRAVAVRVAMMEFAR